jgi:negative modulator of initiation of replication
MNITTRQIEVESDVYAYIVQNTQEIGETASSILRRLLRLPCAGPTVVTTTTTTESEPSELGKLLGSPEFMYAKGVVGRFLSLLKWLHDREPAGFSKVEGIKGRGRIYFAKNPETLKAAGRSVNPKQIPGTDYWVITTTPTTLKQQVIERVMQTLGYNRADIAAATRAMEK